MTIFGGCAAVACASFEARRLRKGVLLIVHEFQCKEVCMMVQGDARKVRDARGRFVEKVIYSKF